MLSALIGATAQGVLWGILGIGIYLTFQVLDIADMTVDGSFSLGGMICGVLLTNGMNAFAVPFVGLVAGAVAGLVTGLLHTKLKIPAILAGILTQVALYSVNLGIASGKSNIPLGRDITVFDWLMNLLPNFTKNMAALVIGIAFVLVIIIALYWFFGTEIGNAIRATGNNPKMSRSLGINTDWMIVLTIMIANGLVAFSGSIVAQYQGYGDVKMGTGAIIIGLASIVIGEVIFGSNCNFAVRLISVVVGSIIYQLIIAIVLQLGLPTIYRQALTSVVVVLAMMVPMIQKTTKQSNAAKREG